MLSFVVAMAGVLIWREGGHLSAAKVAPVRSGPFRVRSKTRRGESHMDPRLPAWASQHRQWPRIPATVSSATPLSPQRVVSALPYSHSPIPGGMGLGLCHARYEAR